MAVAAVSLEGCPGYYVASSSGQVEAYGSARYHGGLGNPAYDIVGITATADGGGYWLVGANGAVYAFGDAGYYGGAGNLALDASVLGMAVTQDSGGYWEVAGDGGIFSFTSDGFYGSMGGKPLNRPVIGMAGTPDGKGHTLVASDGGVFTFGDSPFYGSLGSNPPASPIVDLSPCPGNNGYYLLDGDGQVFPFGPGTRVPSTLTMTLPPLPDLTVGRPYQVDLAATGGVAPYTWSRSGTLPPGMSLTPNGLLSGTPTQAGSYRFDVTVADSGAPEQSTTATVDLQVEPQATPALQVTTSGLPAGTAFQAYQAALSATGGNGAYTWSLASGSLPDGLTLSSAGDITRSPTEDGAFAFTVEVRDSAGHTASAALSMLVSIPTQDTVNWAGYLVTGGPFTGVEGSFTVPSLTSASTPNEDMSTWVGIDGSTNRDLIQAGVSLDPDPNDPSQYFTIQPWWEILPQPETPITGTTVSIGDQMTVDIDQVSGTEWAIEITDDRTGQQFVTDQTYTGPADSAEWIVEAPTVGGTQTSLAPFAPNVTFGDLHVSQEGTSIDRVVLVDPYTGQQTATPSDLDATGFEVSYGPDTPPSREA